MKVENNGIVNLPCRDLMSCNNNMQFRALLEKLKVPVAEIKDPLDLDETVIMHPDYLYNWTSAGGNRIVKWDKKEIKPVKKAVKKAAKKAKK